MPDLVANVRFAIRNLAKRKGWSALLVTTLALGLAANAVIFNFMDALVLRAFDFPNQARLVRVWETGRDYNGVDRSNVAPANLLDWREQAGPVFDGLLGLEWWNANLRGREVAERVQGYRVSPGFFEALGVRPSRGRGFTPEEGRSGHERRVVMGHALWQRSFGGAAGTVGSKVTIDGEPYTVVGIAPPGFAFPDGTDVWAPLVLPAPAEARRDQHYLSVLGLLADGRTREEARAALGVVSQRLAREHPETNTARGSDVGTFSLGFGDPILPSLLLIWQAAAVLVLLIACVNVANLILARGAERRRELALRLALGAGRGRIVRQLLTEGVVAGLAAAALALPLQALASHALRVNMPAEVARFLPGWQLVGADARSLLFSVLLAVLAAMLFSLVPAWRAARPDQSEALRDGGRSVAAGGARQRGRNLLVVGQLAAALALVATASLAVKSAHALLNGPQGYEPQGVLAMDVTLSETRYAEPERRRAYVRDALSRLAQLPGVTHAAAASQLPARGGFTSRAIEVEGRPLAKGVEPPEVEARWVTPGLLETLRLPVFEGRGLEPSDDEQAPAVALVSRALAARTWPGQPAIGKRFRVVARDAEQPWITVVGVTGDVVQQWVMRRNAPTFYQPLAQQPRLKLAFALRVAGDPDALARSAQRALQAVDPDQPARDVESMRRSIARGTIGLQYVAAIMAAFGLLALALAVSGVYGVMSLRVSLRTLEFGLRVALGASRLDVLRLALGQALRLAALGLALGAGLAVAASRVLSSTLRGAIASDPALLAGVTGLLAAAALLAAWIPARRALAVDPAETLRAE